MKKNYRWVEGKEGGEKDKITIVKGGRGVKEVGERRKKTI